MKHLVSLLMVGCLLSAFQVCAEERVEAKSKSPQRSPGPEGPQAMMGPPPGEYKWLSDEKRTEIPFELAKNHVIIPVTVQGRPMKFVLDTGMPAHGAILFGGSNCDSVPLDYVGEAQVGGVGGGLTQARMAAGATIELGGLRLTQQMVIVMPPDRERGLAFEDRDGAIGYALFSRFVVRLDFDRMVMKVEEPGEGAPPDSAEALPITFANNVPKAKCSVEMLDGTVVPLELVVDLGASHAVSLNTGAHPEMSIPEGAIEARLGRGVGGALDGRIGRVRSLTLAGRRLENVVASFRSKAHDGAPGLEAMERDGNLGADALRRFNVTFDYGRKVMLLEPNSHFGEPFEFDMAGIEYSRTEEGSVVVERVVPDSPAQEAGLWVGDVVTKADGRDVSSMSLENLRLLLMRPGKQVSLSFVRDGKEKQVTLTLRRLL